MFSEILVREGFKTIHAPDDGNIFLARAALAYSKQKQVKVITEDTDILLLLWHYVDKDVHLVIFQSKSRTWNIQHFLHKIGKIPEVILLIHAFFGCDTFFRICGIGKDKITKSLKLFNICCGLPSIFYNHLSSKLDTQEAEGKFFGLYNRVKIRSLEKLGHKVFMKMVARKSVVKPKMIPLTIDSPKYHFSGVFYQMQVWLRCSLNSLKWG